jgi:enoyl-CoA hydratase/carnithine racemase
MQVIKFEQTDSVGHIVLANPPKNLIDSNFSDSLKRAVHQAGESNIRALLVRAEGPNFSQGGANGFGLLSRMAFRTFIGECNQSFRVINSVVSVYRINEVGTFQAALRPAA